ncbi:hypothetical protein FHS76_004555 [Ochrobactrum daejeonense]|uniref:Uncharacterized protein n=1 Tax=Brucella daejeonensis TaxID=659015 RepID=A0A7W9B274_9HYPH|nr:hypothetical protein [Brucella daejeonensis]MBB5704631.1 hypothetical protein [Brucella daejeonensis]
MKVTNMLQAIYGHAIQREGERYEKWISISHKLGAIAGGVSVVTLQRNARLDLMLRTLENERLERIANVASEEPIYSLDLQMALSENWVMSAYEVARAAKDPIKISGENSDRLLKLEYRLALVRIPMVKGVIKGMDFSKNKKNPPMMQKVGDDKTELYENDGNYIMPTSLCKETGAVVWMPVDINQRSTIAVCRRDLSDEMLAIFD